MARLGAGWLGNIIAAMANRTLLCTLINKSSLVALGKNRTGVKRPTCRYLSSNHHPNHGAKEEQYNEPGGYLFNQVVGGTI